MRTFIAADITPEIRKRLSEFVDKTRASFPGARWARPEGLHITLKFLGEITADQKEQVEAAVRRIKSQHFEISIRGLGFFPNTRSPRVFWAGIEAGGQLPALASAVDEALLPLGFPKEKQSYNPHLTLARFNPGTKANAASAKSLLEAPPPEFGTMTANEFFLYQSKLSPRGSIYSKLTRFDLEGEPL
ncbi:MAG TPA: RNA 2',3'-cyclic phosphodiesterase [Terriglobales bacterium]